METWASLGGSEFGHQRPNMEQAQPSRRHESGEAHALLSCARCRSRKLKCDRKRPQCDRCLKQSEPCSYPGLRQRGLGPRKTVRELEERIGGLKHDLDLLAPTQGHD